VDDDLSDSPGAGDRCLGRRAGPDGLRLEIVPAAGRPAYHTATPLKLYIFGYLDRVQSSRRLERDPQRNVELMWLTGKLAPDHKTIAKSRKDDGEAAPLVAAAAASSAATCRTWSTPSTTGSPHTT
jgi:hypothetical protein